MRELVGDVEAPVADAEEKPVALLEGMMDDGEAQDAMLGSGNRSSSSDSSSD